MTAKRVAEEFYDIGLEGDELLAAMCGWHDETVIETRDMYNGRTCLTSANHD